MPGRLYHELKILTERRGSPITRDSPAMSTDTHSASIVQFCAWPPNDWESLVMFILIYVVSNYVALTKSAPQISAFVRIDERVVAR
jgi:hypothetical protein